MESKYSPSADASRDRKALPMYMNCLESAVYVLVTSTYIIFRFSHSSKRITKQRFVLTRSPINVRGSIFAAYVHTY
jgi:hypothetical protein